MIENKERAVIAEMRTDSLSGGARSWYALGLAILVTVADARAHMLSASSQPVSAALVAGFQWAFYAGACLALIGALLAFLVPSPGKRSP